VHRVNRSLVGLFCLHPVQEGMKIIGIINTPYGSLVQDPCKGPVDYGPWTKVLPGYRGTGISPKVFFGVMESIIPAACAASPVFPGGSGCRAAMGEW
jgi:hypothetical protein